MHTDEFQRGDKIADAYEIEALLGGGGMGKVYLARDMRLDRSVAIKVMRADLTASPQAEARFLREARTLSRVVHPNIVAVHDFGRLASGYFVAMEFVEGESLDHRLATRGPIDLPEVVDITQQIASGLAEIHALGLVHRDIKPGNILLRRLASGALHAKLVDFGLARDIAVAPADMVTRAVGLLGTPNYMSPEQIEGKPLDGRSDLYALAVVVFQMLTGILPYHRDTLQATLRAHLVESPPSLLALANAGRWPQGVERTVHLALAKLPEDRPPDVSAFADALAKAAAVRRLDLAGDVDCACCGRRALSGQYCVHCGAGLPQGNCRACGEERQGFRETCGHCGASLLPALPAETAGFELRAATTTVLIAQWHAAAHLGAAAPSVAREIEAAGGRVVAALGTEITALFGLGGADELHTAAALDAGLSLLRWAAAHWPEAALRIGVDMGRTFSVGPAHAWGAAWASGEAVDAARTVVATCPAGHLCVGPMAFRDVRALFQTSRVPHGASRLVLQRRDVSLALADYAQNASDAPLVSREDDLALLLRTARKARRQEALIAVPVIGPRASGKTRIINEFLRVLEDEAEPWQVYLGRCSGLGIPVAYEPLVGVLRARLATTESDSDAALLDRLADLPGLDEGDPALLQNRVTALGRLLGLSAADAAIASRPATQAEQQAAFDAYVAFLRGTCAIAPTVLIIEDLQWAREGTLQLLAHIVRGCADTALVLLLPVRQDRAEPVLTALSLPTARSQPVELDPLEQADVAALIAAMRPGAQVPPPVLQMIAALAEGLPGQVEELVEVMTADGLFVVADDGWSLREDRIASAGLARSLAEAVMRRLGRLAPAERAIVEAVAVTGNYAPRGMIEAILQRPVAEAELEQVKLAGLVIEPRQVHFKGEREFALRRPELAPLLAEAWQSAPLRAAHKRAARWLLAWKGPRPLGIGAMLAHFHRGAGEGAPAVRYMMQAAEASMRALANRDAFETFAAAAEVARDWSDQAKGAHQPALQAWIAALLGQAETGLLLGEHEAVVSATGQVLALEAASDDTPAVGLAMTRALTLLGEAQRNMGHHQQALQTLRSAIDRAHALPDGGLWELRAHAVLSAVLMRRGDYDEAESLAQTALAGWRGGTDSPDEQAALGRLHTWMGHAAGRRSDFVAARTHYDDARACFARAQDDVAVAMADLSIGNLIYRMGDLDRAAEVYRRIVEICKPIEYMHGCAVAEVNLGHVLIDQRRFREALDVLRRAEQTIRRLGSLDSLPEALRLIALALMRCGDAHGARRTAAEAVQQAETMNHVQLADGARAVLQEAEQLANSLSATTYAPEEEAPTGAVRGAKPGPEPAAGPHVEPRAEPRSGRDPKA